MKKTYYNKSHLHKDKLDKLVKTRGVQGKLLIIEKQS